MASAPTWTACPRIEPTTRARASTRSSRRTAPSPAPRRGRRPSPARGRPAARSWRCRRHLHALADERGGVGEPADAALQRVERRLQVLLGRPQIQPVRVGQESVHGDLRGDERRETPRVSIDTDAIVDTPRSADRLQHVGPRVHRSARPGRSASRGTRARGRWDRCRPVRTAARRRPRRSEIVATAPRDAVEGRSAPSGPGRSGCRRSAPGTSRRGGRARSRSPRRSRAAALR